MTPVLDGRSAPFATTLADFRWRHRLSVAPMMDWTDRHCRFFLRLLSRHVLLYTEMITTQAIRHGIRERLLGFSPAERPLALQLGGDDPAALAESAEIAEALGYDEVNLNVGCPSDRVQSGNFGACLMKDPHRVADGVAAMKARVRIPVTVKHRIGVDDLDGYEHMHRFVSIVAGAGCDAFIVHARKAWLQGLSPRENREVPPLRYPEVHRLKRERSDLHIEINGGILTLDQALDQLEHVDGVMMGRAVYENPYLLAEADARIFGDPGSTPPERREVLEQLISYYTPRSAAGEPLIRLTRHILGLYHGRPGARAFKRYLSENACRPGAGVEVLREVIDRLEQLRREAEAREEARAAGGSAQTRAPAAAAASNGMHHNDISRRVIAVK